MVSKLYSVLSNISWSARKIVRVPRRCPCGPTWTTAVVGLPRTYSWAQMNPSRAVSTRSHSESAFTPLTPTPCSPPDTLYPPPPRLPRPPPRHHASPDPSRIPSGQPFVEAAELVLAIPLDDDSPALARSREAH